VTARVVASARARAELIRILSHLRDQAGHGTASKYQGWFEAAFDRLAVHPQGGSPRPALGRNIRMVVVEPYLILYRFDARTDVVSVLGVLHGHRHITAAEPP